MIVTKGLRKRFGNLQVLDGIDLNLEKGHCIALIGPNGCGKTTLIKSILGMVIPDQGEIEFKGKSIRRDFSYRNNIGYMPQIGRYPENISIGQTLGMIKSLRKDSPIDEDLYLGFDLPSLLPKKMRTLSGGTRQKVSATLAFMFNPDVLILDEPTAGLDPLAQEILKNKILKEKDRGKLILITSHMLSELDDLITQLIFMQEGKVLFHKNVGALKEETGEHTISKAVTGLLKKSRV